MIILEKSFFRFPIISLIIRREYEKLVSWNLFRGKTGWLPATVIAAIIFYESPISLLIAHRQKCLFYIGDGNP